MATILGSTHPELRLNHHIQTVYLTEGPFLSGFSFSREASWDNPSRVLASPSLCRRTSQRHEVLTLTWQVFHFPKPRNPILSWLVPLKGILKKRASRKSMKSFSSLLCSNIWSLLSAHRKPALQTYICCSCLRESGHKDSLIWFLRFVSTFMNQINKIHIALCV